jgi:hypothetical protein
MVAVRAVVVPGGHGPYLTPLDECAYRLVTRGVVWPNIISLVCPNNQSPDVNDHAPFKLDRRAIEAEEAHVRTAGYELGLDVEVATYVGLFETHLDLEKRVSPDIPGALRVGFGPAGLDAPAQLVIKTVKDVSVIHARKQGEK